MLIPFSSCNVEGSSLIEREKNNSKLQSVLTDIHVAIVIIVHVYSVNSGFQVV